MYRLLRSVPVMAVLRSLCDINITVSSAYIDMLLFVILLDTSLIYIKKSNGPRTLP